MQPECSREIKVKKTAILALILACLTTYFYLYEMKPAIKEEIEIARAQRLFIFDPSEIKEIRLENRKGSVILKREDDKWWIVKPQRHLASKEVVWGLVFALLEEEVEVIEKPYSLAEFGLLSSEITLKIIRENRPSLILFTGDRTPVGNRVYARRDPKGDVILISPKARFILNKGAEDFIPSE